MNPYLRETLIGLAAGSVSIVAVVALMEGGAPGHFVSAAILLLISFVAPVLAVPALPWLLVLFVSAGGLVYLQYQRVPSRFMRYLVGAEVIAWLYLGMWCTANFVAA